MAFSTITSGEIAAGKPVKQSLEQKIKDNFDDLDSRVSGLAASGNVQVFNQILRMAEIPIGAAIWSWDTLANSQATGLSSNWVRPEGSGTWTDGADASNNVPDARNRFLRMSTAYAAVNVTDLVADSTAANGLTGSSGAGGQHNHKWYQSPNASYHGYSYDDTGAALQLNTCTSSGNYGITAATSGTILDSDGNGTTRTDHYTAGVHNIAAGDTHTHTLASITGDAETAPIHIKQNLLFKKAYAYGEKKLLFKAAFAFTINNAVLTQLEYGTDTTTIEIDCKVGDVADLRASTMTSIFSTKPSVQSDGATDFVEATNGVLGASVTVASGEYVELSVSSYQTGLSEIFVQISGIS